MEFFKDKLLRFFLVLFVLANSATTAGTATTAEKRDFSTAMRWYQGGWWEKADEALGNFINRYPNSDLVPEAIIRRAQAKLKKGDFEGAYNLLITNANALTPVQEQFFLTLGEAAWAKGDFITASKAFKEVWERFPGSINAPLAAYNQALALTKLSLWDDTVSLMTNPACPLYSFFTLEITNQLAIDTKLLYTEALIATKRFDEAKKILTTVPIPPEDECTRWRRDYQLAVLTFNCGDLTTAINLTSNLLTSARQCTQKPFLAETLLLQTKCYLAIGDTNTASTLIESLLSSNMPTQYRQWALATLVEFALKSGDDTKAAIILNEYKDDEAFSGVFPLVSAELALFQAEKLIPPSTNCPTGKLLPTNAYSLLVEAIQQASKIQVPLGSTLQVPQAPLVKAWAYWHLGDLSNCTTTLQLNLEKFKNTSELPLAFSKLADAQFCQGLYESALSNYINALDALNQWPSLKAHILPRALYQALASAIYADLPEQANRLLERIIRESPTPDIQQRAFLFWGLYATKQHDYTDAIRILTEFCQKFPSSPLLPEAQLMLGHLYQLSGDYQKALEIYDNWSLQNTSHQLWDHAQYKRAITYAQCGRVEEAINIMKQLAAKTNSLAATAQFWIADRYFRLSDLAKAEENYQLVFHRWPSTEIARRAKLNAARVAAVRAGFNDAVKYCFELTNDPSTPAELVAESLFLYGDILTKMPSSDSTAPGANVEEAIRVFSKIIQLFPTNELAIHATGRIGDCYLILGSYNPAFYENALTTYSNLITNPVAPAQIRSQAEIGLGIALEKMATKKSPPHSTNMLTNALFHYLRVIYGENLRAGETADSFWIKEAAVRAIKIMDDLQLAEQKKRLIEFLEHTAPDIASFLLRRGQ